MVIYISEIYEKGIFMRFKSSKYRYDNAMTDNNMDKAVFRFISLVVCVMLVSNTVFAYLIYTYNSKSIYGVYLENELEVLQNSIHDFYSEARNFCAAIYMDNDTKKVTQTEEVNNAFDRNLHLRLLQYSNTNLFTKSIYIYDKSKGMFYTSESMLPYDEDKFDLDTEILSVIESDKTFLVRKIPQSDISVYTVIMLPFNGHGDAVVINYYVTVFANNYSQNSKILILDENKRCFASSYMPVGADLSQEKFINKIYEENSDHGRMKEKIDDKKSIVAYKKSKGFTFINTEYNFILVTKIIQRTAFLFFLLMLFSIVIPSLFIIYIRKIYGFIYVLFTKMEDMKFKIQSSDNEKNQEKLRELLKLVLYEPDVDIKNMIKGVKLNVDTNSGINVILFKIDDRNKFLKENTLREQKSIRYSIVNVLSEMFGTAVKYDICVVSDCEIVFIYNTEQTDREQIFETISKFQTFFSNNIGITLSAFVGSGQANILELSKLIAEVVNLSEYRIYEGYECILTADYLEKNNEDPNNTFDMQIQILTALKSGSYEKALVAFEKMLDELQKFSPFYMRGELFQLAYQIRQNILRGTDCSILNNIEDAETLDELKELFTEAFLYITENITNIKEERYEGFVKRVKQIVEENYQNPDFSRNMVADMMNMNVKYADTLFKKYTQTTIAAYITDFRLQKSQQLLKTTKSSINDIATLVGYSGGSYFVYSFRKKYGMTPSEYRKNTIQ